MLLAGEVKYFGHILSSSFLQQDKIAAISHKRPHEKQSELETVLRMANYPTKLIPYPPDVLTLF